MYQANLLSCRPWIISPRLSADLLRFRPVVANQRCTACPAKCWRRTIFVPNERRLLVDRRRKTEWTGVGAHGAKFRISPAPAVGPGQWKLVVVRPSSTRRLGISSRSSHKQFGGGIFPFSRHPTRRLSTSVGKFPRTFRSRVQHHNNAALLSIC